MQIQINKEFQKLIPPLMEDELNQLKENLKKEGWRKNEFILIWDNFIVDGHNRYNLCKELNIEFKIQEKEFKDEEEAKLWIIDNQLGRRNLLPYDRVRLNLKKEAILKPIAKENLKTNVGGKHMPLPTLAKADTRETISKLAKVSHGTVDKVKFIEAKADKETKEKLSKGEETINRAYQTLKGQERVEQAKEEINKNPKELLEEYQIILADPPWRYNRTIGEGVVKRQYPTLSLEEIKLFLKDNKIKIKENSVLFLWVTFPLLKEGLEVIESWGFKYKTCGFNWVKLNKNGKAFFGIGEYTKHNSELCLLSIKGKGLPVLDDTISQIIMTEKEKHSKKPNEVKEKIVKLFGDRKRIELFAREKTKGWDVWGNEIDDKI